MPEQALGGIPLDFGTVVEDKPSKLSCVCTYNAYARIRTYIVSPLLDEHVHLYIGDVGFD